MDRDAGGTCYVLSGGMWGKADDSSVTAGILRIWTRTRFSPERYRISLRMRMERS